MTRRGPRAAAPSRTLHRVCKRCSGGYEYVTRSRPSLYCEACRDIVKCENQAIRRERTKAKQKLRGGNPSSVKTGRRIRYAGYDPTERSAWGYEPAQELSNGETMYDDN